MASKSVMPAGYAELLARVKERVRTAQIKAALSANRELILLYWDIGRAIVEAQKDKGYGKRVVEMLSVDLRREFPTMTGLSALNLWRMRAFYLAYASNQKLSQPVTESAGAIELLASLPWGHNIVLMQKVKQLNTRLWYARAVEVNIAIMRTFVQLRRLMDTNRDLARKIEALEKKYDEQYNVRGRRWMDCIGRLVRRPSVSGERESIRRGLRGNKRTDHSTTSGEKTDRLSSLTSDFSFLAFSFFPQWSDREERHGR
jgi:predicted nuclease of restriction endonuclease-like (RecB) superfamily